MLFSLMQVNQNERDMKSAKFILSIASLFFLASSFMMCTPADRNEMEEEGEEMETVAEAEWMEEKQELRTNYENTIRDIDTRLENLERQMEEEGAEASAETREEWQEMKANLEQSKTELQEEMNEIEMQTEETWADFKRGVNNSIAEIDQELEEWDAAIDEEMQEEIND